MFFHVLGSGYIFAVNFEYVFLYTLGKTASPKESYNFLRHEEPIRLAHIMQEISHLPKNLLSMPSVKRVSGWYVLLIFFLLYFLLFSFYWFFLWTVYLNTKRYIEKQIEKPVFFLENFCSFVVFNYYLHLLNIYLHTSILMALHEKYQNFIRPTQHLSNITFT